LARPFVLPASCGDHGVDSRCRAAAEIARLKTRCDLVGIFGVFTTLPLVLYPGPVLKLIGAPDELVEAGSVYFQLFSAPAPLIVMSAVTTATFRSLNDSKTPMFVTMGAVGLNTVLGLFLVFGWGPFPKLGVIGAGLASLDG
jgi:Na+-driven multidrug efflux pump